MALESRFQARLIRELEDEFPGAVVLKTDPNYIQGFPDLLLLQATFWAALEVKRARNSARQPNQEYWVQRLNLMSYSRFVYPGNLDDVLEELSVAHMWSMNPK
jgi:hypothetical protein